MSDRDRSSQRQSKGLVRIVVVAVFVLFAMISCVSLVGGGAIWFINNTVEFAEDDYGVPVAPTWSPESAELTLAVSPVMAPVISELADTFNDQEIETVDGQTMRVRPVIYEPEKMVEAAVAQPEFQAMSPDSSLWLDRLEQAWVGSTDQAAEDRAQAEDATIPIGQGRVAEQTRYAVSPIVIAAWEDTARELGWPDQPVGWREIQRLASEDASFKWSHPSTNNAAGLLATLAEFYAGTGTTRGLTEEAATAQETLDYVQAIESTVRFYGEGEEIITQRLATEGRDFLDAFVAQERTVIDWNRLHPNSPLVAIYPAEGTLWTDHPLALLELGDEESNSSESSAVTANQRLVFQRFAEFLAEPASQRKLLAAGYRPADLSIPLDGDDSPFAGSERVDWREPQTTLQMPPPAVIDVVQNVWRYAKRPTNVYLVVDTSGSMEGRELRSTQEALTAFVEQIQGERDQVGLVEFGTDIKAFRPVRTLDDQGRQDLLSVIENMDASGNTALVDATYAAAVDLRAQADSGAINALVVMTDGRENASHRGLGDLQRLMQEPDAPSLVVFTIAFGRNADEDLMRAIAEIGNGQFRQADEMDIEELYRVISTYF